MTSRSVLKLEASVSFLLFVSTAERRSIIVGAALLVISYTVKEVFREKSKAFRDSLAAAERDLRAGDLEQMASSRQIAANIHLRNLQRVLSDSTKANAISKHDLQMEILDLNHAYSDVAASVDRVSDLLNQLPSWVKGRQRAGSELKSRLERTRKNMEDSIRSNKIPDPEVKNHALLLLEIVRVMVFGIEVSAWQESVLKTARNLKRIADGMYKATTWLGWILFTLGVAIGLYGKLH